MYYNYFEELNREYLGEMATVHRDAQCGILIQVNPSKSRIGERYFKFYNSSSYSSATKIIRISFDSPKYIFHVNEDGKEDWILNSKEKKLLVNILNKPSNSYPDYSVWEVAKFNWNNEALKNQIAFPLYQSGFYDNDLKDDPNYVASFLAIPDYTKLS